MTDALLWAGAGGAVAFVIVFLIDGATRSGYSVRRHPVSALALGPRGWLQTTNFLVCGALVTAGGSACSSQHRARALTREQPQSP